MDRWVACWVVGVLIAAGCSGPDTARTADEAVVDTAVDADQFVIEPLVPQEALPPSMDRHYDFAHIVLPTIIFSSPPEDVREQFLGPDAQRFLRAQWTALHDTAPATQPSAVRVQVEDGVDALVIEMPPPEKNAHAYFAMITFKISGIRYLTLERSVWMKDDGPQRTVLGEWSIEDGEPVHATYGEGPAPQHEAFVDAVRPHLR